MSKRLIVLLAGLVTIACASLARPVEPTIIVDVPTPPHLHGIYSIPVYHMTQVPHVAFWTDHHFNEGWPTLHSIRDSDRMHPMAGELLRCPYDQMPVNHSVLYFDSRTM